MLTNLLSWLYPPCCAVCSSRLEKEATLCSICAPAEGYIFAQAFSESACPHCSEFHQLFDGGPCLECSLWPLPVRELRSLWRYTPSTRALLQALKYRPKHAPRKALAAAIGSVLADAVQTPRFFNHHDWQTIVVVPSSAKRLRARAGSHLFQTAKIMSKRLQIPFSPLALQEHGNTSAQAKTPLENRFVNVQGAFIASSRSVRAKSILLIDDVITSGSSISEASRALLDAGASSVDALTLTRSYRFRKARRLLSQESSLSLSVNSR